MNKLPKALQYILGILLVLFLIEAAICIANLFIGAGLSGIPTYQLCIAGIALIIVFGYASLCLYEKSESKARRRGHFFVEIEIKHDTSLAEHFRRMDLDEFDLKYYAEDYILRAANDSAYKQSQDHPHSGWPAPAL